MSSTKIYTTTDYKKFRKAFGNRDVNGRHVDDIVKSIEKHGYIETPIICNEKLEIIDGQHTFEAVKRLGLPVSYVVKDGLTVSDCRTINSLRSNWTSSDYVESYAATGNRNYILLKKLTEKTGFSAPLIVAILSGSLTIAGGVTSAKIKDGEIKITGEEYEKILDVCEYIHRFDAIIKAIDGSTSKVRAAIAWIVLNTPASREALYRAFRQHHVDLPAMTTSDRIMTAIDGIYNYHRKKKVSIADLYKKEDQDENNRRTWNIMGKTLRYGRQRRPGDGRDARGSARRSRS